MRTVRAAAAYIDGLELRIKELEADNARLRAALRLAIIFLNSLHLPVGVPLATQRAYDELRAMIRRALEKSGNDGESDNRDDRPHGKGEQP